jgi:ribose 5-phosphate isomerase RpiB
MLVIGADKLSVRQAARIVAVWCRTPFEAGSRHERRVKQIAAIERRYGPTRRKERTAT